MINHKVSGRTKRKIKEIVHNLKRQSHLQQKIIKSVNEECSNLKQENEALKAEVLELRANPE